MVKNKLTLEEELLINNIKIINSDFINELKEINKKHTNK